MAGNTVTRASESLLTSKGQDSFTSNANSSSKIVFPAIVRSINDNAKFNRIQAEIVNLDNSGNVTPGRDKNIPANKLPVCIPFLSEFSHIRPKVGEMVIVIAENPTDLSSVRYWLGPLMTSQINLPFQSYQDSFSIFNTGTFSNNEISNSPTLQTQALQQSVLPSQTDIALQSRNDADVVLKSREVLIRAGNFTTGSTFTQLNTTTPCTIQLKQFDANPNLTGIQNVDLTLSQNFQTFSQQNFVATNFNFLSPTGKYRKFDPKTTPEAKTNPQLLNWGGAAQSLSPAVRGDELIALLTVMIQYLLNHIHLPQSTPLPNNLSAQLEPYLAAKMQDLLSNCMRIS